MTAVSGTAMPHEVRIGDRLGLMATLGVPRQSRGLVIFTHGSGSGRLSPRNNYVAARLRHDGVATLLRCHPRQRMVPPAPWRNTMLGHAVFADRHAAGRDLAKAVSALGLEAPVILALPRGGVPVGYEVAKALRAPLDILMVRKIGAPGHEEYGIGALVDGASPQVVIDEAMAAMVGATRAYIDLKVQRELAEIERRRALYRPGPPVTLRGRNVIVVDDGIATGSTVRAARQGLGQTQPARIVLAVPLAPGEVLPEIRELCDEVICLASPWPFNAVGMHYRDFSQTDDDEVIRLLAEAKGWDKSDPGAPS